MNPRPDRWLPPENDPMSDGQQLWADLRSKYLTVCDRLDAAEGEISQKDRVIDHLTADNKRLRQMQLDADEEASALRTWFKAIAGNVLDGLRDGKAKREQRSLRAYYAPGEKAPSPPPVTIDKADVPPHIVGEIEDLVGRIAANRPHQGE